MASASIRKLVDNNFNDNMFPELMYKNSYLDDNEIGLNGIKLLLKAGIPKL
jgi:hypothetical protein